MDLETDIQVLDKQFELFLSNGTIHEKIAALAEAINRQFIGKELEIIIIMEGAEAFANAIIPLFNFSYNIHYQRIKSYIGMQSKGVLDFESEWISLLKQKELLILEDIIDTGLTLNLFIKFLEENDIKKVYVASLLLKPAQLKYELKPDFTGFEIGPEFIIGFGMDYNEEGRQLSGIYRLKS
ncbi:MAG: hypoxanthine phosphoribosyltransferase [Saprospiraceae bacterium]|nr:hypoxanthine phosphoribosyltransferase [Saprospiraceae bacterium]MBK8483139.1 hypoxanthine phosphoribosyltransferase [Saprospiraceae bacterium]MBK9722481.1 hypoxanthine phosphoribosyltransferase [Saprospiraceae bacterium]MBK9729499.1 hypoxanthine phosphoribosyltransferase [Saprospiraceae bacterium]